MFMKKKNDILTFYNLSVTESWSILLIDKQISNNLKGIFVSHDLLIFFRRYLFLMKMLNSYIMLEMIPNQTLTQTITLCDQVW